MSATYEDVMTALRNADAAGAADDARKLARIAASMRPSAPAAPPPAPAVQTGASAPTESDPAWLAGQTPAQQEAPARAPGLMDFLTGAPRQGQQQAPGVGALRKGVGGLEALASTGTSLVPGGLGAVLSAANNAVGTVLQKLGVPGVRQGGQPLETALTQGMQAGAQLGYTPRTTEGQELTEAAGQKMVEHGPALMGLGPELAVLGKIISTGARAARDMGAGATVEAAVPTAVRNAAQGTAKAAVKGVAAVTPNISPETAAVVQKAANFGIDLPPDAFGKNKFARIAGEASRNVPFSGAGAEENAVAFNSALARRIGAVDEAGKPLPKITPKVFDDAVTQSGETIGRVTAENPVPIDAVQSTVDSLREAAGKRSGDVGKAVEGYLKDIEAKAAENDGVVPGTAMKEILGQLGRDAYSATDGNVRNALGELHRALTGDVAKVLGPEDAAVLRKARQQYSDALTIVPLVRPSGDISPSAFNQAFRAGRAGKLRAARGTGGEMGDLAEVSQYMREPGSSLTAERALTYAALGGGAKIEPHAAAATAVGANLYNRLGPAVLREKAGAVKAKPGTAPAEAGPVTAETAPVAVEPAPATPAEPVDPRLASIEEARAAAKSDAVRAALDEHEKAVRKTIAAEAAAKKQAADVRELEAAAKATEDPGLRASLQAKADKLRAEKIPVGEVIEGQPKLPAEKVSKIPVGQTKEGQPALPVEKPAKVPAGEATEITPESVEPAAEPIPVGEATEVAPVPAGEATEIAPEVIEPPEPIPTGEATPLAPNHALYEEATRRGIEIRGKRPGEVRSMVEAQWAAEHKLSPFDAERAKTVAKALDIDEKAVENAAVQHERSPRMFDKAIDRIIEQGAENAPETKQVATGSEGNPPNPAGGEASPSAGRGGNANVGAERAGSGEGKPAAAGAAQAPAEQPGANGPAATGTRGEGNQPGGQAEKAAGGVKSLTISYGKNNDTSFTFSKEPWKLTAEQLERELRDAKMVVGRGRSTDATLRMWKEARGKALDDAVKAGEKVPAENLYEQPRLVRSDLNDSQSDLAADAMVDAYKATKSYDKAVQVYRDWKPEPKGFEKGAGKDIRQEVPSGGGGTTSVATGRERELRAKAHDTEQPGDVMLGNDRFVSFEDAKAAARRAIDDGVLRNVPFQYNNILDIAPRDWVRMVEAMKGAKPKKD